MHRALRRCGALALALHAACAVADGEAPEPELLEFIGEWKDDEVVLETEPAGDIDLPSGGAAVSRFGRDEGAASAVGSSDEAAAGTEQRRD